MMPLIVIFMRSLKRSAPVNPQLLKVYSGRQAFHLKNGKSMQWHPLMIKRCQYLRQFSGKAYNDRYYIPGLETQLISYGQTMLHSKDSALLFEHCIHGN